MSARFRDIPPRAVSQLFGLCTNAPGGVLRPSLYDDALIAKNPASDGFAANPPIGSGIHYLNWQRQMEKSGYLVSADGRDPETARKKQQQEFEAYFLQNWLSRMSEEYQRAYEELMHAIEDAEKFCDDIERELAEKRQIVDRQMDRILQNAVQIDRQEFIPDGRGGYTDRHGRPRNSSNTRPEVLAEVDRRYKQEPWRLDALSDAQDWINAKEDLEKLERENNLFKQGLQEKKDNQPASAKEAQEMAEDIRQWKQNTSDSLAKLRNSLNAANPPKDAPVNFPSSNASYDDNKIDSYGIKALSSVNSKTNLASSLALDEGDVDSFGIEAAEVFNRATVGNEDKSQNRPSEPLYSTKIGETSPTIKSLPFNI